MSEVADDSLERARRERAAARAARVTIVRTALGADERDASVRGAEAIALAAQLSRAAWSLAGRPWPEVDRSTVTFAFVPRAPRA